jgi:hypothetical protein
MAAPFRRFWAQANAIFCVKPGNDDAETDF